MIYGYKVKINGVWHNADEDITCQPKADTRPINDITRKALDRMTLAQLRAICDENAIAYEDESTKAILKADIIERLGLE